MATNPPGKSKTPPEEKDEARTPPFVFAFAKRRFAFDIDLASTAANAVCPWYLTKSSDALSLEWHKLGKVGWLNPPYSDTSPWLKHAVEEAGKGFTTVMLIPTPNGESQYGQYVIGHASEVIFIDGRLSFLRPDGKPMSGNPRGSAFVIYRAFDLGCTRYAGVARDHMEQLFEEAAA